MIAWPLIADQRMNAFFLVKEAMAIQAKNGPDGLVSKEEMEGDDGEKIKRRMRELTEKANNAIAEGGSSYNSMATVAAVWKTVEGHSR